MTTTVTAWLIITLILGVIASLAIWARGISRARGLAVLAFLLASPVAAGALGMSLGWPIPYLEGVTVPPGKHPLLGAKILIDDGIYILLDIGEGQPRYYKVPWDPKTGDALQGAMDEEGEGNVGVVAKPFEWSWDQGEPKFYADPQPRMLPDKPREDTAPHFEQAI